MAAGSTAISGGVGRGATEVLADVVVCGAVTLRDCEDDDDDDDDREDDDDECEEPHPPNIRPAHTAASSRLMPSATM